MNNRIAVVIFAIVVIVIVGVGVYGYNAYSTYSQNGTVTIFAADSLPQYINGTNAKFHSEHPNINVQTTYAGSSALISQIINLNKTPDIMISANAQLIDSKLIPNYASYNIQFATNQLVIAYTNKSANASQINSNNWYQILSTPGVKYSFGDPNSDPAGSYSTMMLLLANSYYNNSSIFTNLVSSKSSITSAVVNGTNYTVNVPTNENPTNGLTIGPNDAAIVPLLQSNSIDYMITYKSIAASANLSYVTLPAELSLTNASYQSIYNNYQLKTFYGSSNSSTTKMGPIIYGVTILNNAPDKQLAQEYVQLMLSSSGMNVTQSSYLNPINPAILSSVSSNLPSILQPYVVNSSSTNIA